MKKILLQIWRILPERLQAILSRIIRPLFVVGVAAVIFDEDGRIFLGKSTYQRFHPWGILGGGLEHGEDAEEAVVREVWEETSIQVKVEKLLLIRSFRPDKFVLYYLCSIQSGVFEPSDEVSEAGFFALDALPDIRPMDVEVLGHIFELMEVHKHELA
jgi:ADP-ribose pyrophosphatase YjhB (NUDIX family)